MEVPSIEQLRKNNPFSKEHRNLTLQAKAIKLYPKAVETLRAEGAALDEELKRRSRDTTVSWQCLVNAYPAIRGELIALRQRVERK
jgi:hypothetical protein